MAKDVSDAVRDALGNVVREAVKNVGDAAPTKKKSGPLSGAKGIVAGAGLAAAAPLAKKGVDALRNGTLPTGAGGMGAKLASKAGDKVGANLKDVVSSKVDEAGGAGGLVKEAASGLLPGSDGDGGGKGGMPGVGKGRRMPVQQAVDVAVPIETAYNQFTQFEDWPEFMHRVTRVTQEDETTVSFATKIWGKTKEFTAKIETQRPDERIMWRVSQGITHAGVVTFHELAPRLTRIEVSLDVDPGSLIEKAARGMRHVKRAVRADLARYKAFIEMQELETGAWRGVIEDGEVVEPHDDSYDEERDYSEIDDLYDLQPDEEDEEESQDEGGDEEEESEDKGGDVMGELPRDRTGKFTRGAGAKSDREIKATRSGGSSSRSSSGRSSQSRSGSGSSSKSGSSSRSSSDGSSKSNGSSKTSGSSKSGGKRQTSRSRGESNGSGSKRSSGSSSSSRRRSSSRS
jgi:uncharacterized membrane protein